MGKHLERDLEELEHELLAQSSIVEDVIYLVKGEIARHKHDITPCKLD